MNNKTLTKGRGSVIGKRFNLETNIFSSGKALCQCESCAMSFICISELIISKKKYLRKKTDEFNACGELLLNTVHEKTHTREKKEFLKNRKMFKCNEDPIQHEKIQTLEQDFEYNIETFLKKATCNIHKKEIIEGNDCEYNDYERISCENSSCLFHQITLSKENHYEFGVCGKSLV